MRTGRHIGQRKLACLHQRPDTLFNVSVEYARVKAKSGVTCWACSHSLHLAKLGHTSCHRVEEVQLIERVRLLVTLLSDVVVAQ